MKKAIIACVFAVMMVGLSATVFAASSYSNKWDRLHTRDWVSLHEDGDGCILLGNNPQTDMIWHNRGNNPHKLAAYWWLWFHSECGLNTHQDE